MLYNKLKLAALCLIFAGSTFAQSSYTFTGIYTGKPMYNIAVKRAGTPIGNITIELFPNIAPKQTRNFDSLVSQVFFDTTAFHRVIPGFVIQGGDPNSRHGPVSTWGYGQPSQPTVPAEFSAAKHLRGILSAARSSNINSATSQFFICVAPAPNLNGQYSIYGRVLAGMSVVDTIVMAPRNSQDRPNLKHEMFVTYISSNDTIPNPPQQISPPQDSVAIDTVPNIPLKWKGVSDGIIYQLQVSDDPNFTTTIISTDVSNLSYNVNGLSGNTWYYWRLRTNNGGHFSAWSPVFRFHTAGETTGIPVYSNGLKKINVFPNPGYGTFTFSDMLVGSTLSVFDQAGRLVFQTVAKDKTVVADLNNKDKGMYFYKIALNDKNISQGRLVIK